MQIASLARPPARPRRAVARGNAGRASAAAASGSRAATAQEMMLLDLLRRENDLLKRELARSTTALPVAEPDRASAGPPAAAAAAPPAIRAPPLSFAAAAASIAWPTASELPPFHMRLRRTLTAAELESNLPPAPAKDAKPMYICHLTAEMAPVAKVGGLGDVVTGLGRAVSARGHRVEVVLPFYQFLEGDPGLVGLAQQTSVSSYHKGAWVSVDVFSAEVTGLPVLLLRPAGVSLFRGPRIYGGSYNETEAYLFFCRAALEVLYKTGRQPDVIHLHEWQTSAAAVLYWDMYHPLGLTKPRLVLTVHNFANAGECRKEELAMTGLDPESYATPDRALDERTLGHNPERLVLLKAGLVYANAVTTVSPTYAKEASAGGAAGFLKPVVAAAAAKFRGVINGIDVCEWNPAADSALPVGFSPANPAFKRLAKRYLRRGLGLSPEAGDEEIDAMAAAAAAAGAGDAETVAAAAAESAGGEEYGRRRPLVVCVTRLVPQKGIHLIKHALGSTLARGGQFVLLGSAPDPRLDAEFSALAAQHAGGDSARVMLLYSESLAHLLYAAADIVLVPSLFEPCGLTQMIALRYGAVPLVRRTGGLADTVRDVDSPDGGPGGAGRPGRGYVFDGADGGSLDAALSRAIDKYVASPGEWDALAADAMGVDNSWGGPAEAYLGIYRGITA